MPEKRIRYPAIPSNPITSENLPVLAKIVDAIRERVQIFSRDRGRIEDSMATIQDLIDLGLVKPEEVSKLKSSRTVNFP
jgi:hypothetical protein